MSVHLKYGLIRGLGVATLEADKLVAFYYLSAFEIRPYNRGGLS